jgi:hypothetical protein
MLQDDLDKFERELSQLHCLRDIHRRDRDGRLTPVKLLYANCPHCKALDTIAKLRAWNANSRRRRPPASRPHPRS